MKELVKRISIKSKWYEFEFWINSKLWMKGRITWIIELINEFDWMNWMIGLDWNGLDLKLMRIQMDGTHLMVWIELH